MQKNFWKDGVRFECQGTGRCCVSRGTHGYVYLTLKDRKRFAKHLGVSTQVFSKAHCVKSDGWYHLKGPEGACQFLKEKSCTVYEARPAQCRTWPFWPENMNAKTWNEEVTTFCPGIGKGRLYSAEEIEDLLKQDPLNQ
ncbi:MAG: YkgJ family cysteine cluster protein [Methylotenera sp.]|nr:YkgJ family cysteine cluster protein [Oligoflexia bacterium]